MAFGSPSVKGRALRYLSQREHSRVELERKLSRCVADTPELPAAAQISQALDELSASGLLSETRVAASVLRSQGARFGSRRLRQTLQAKGLAADLVVSTLQEAQATDLQRAGEVWRRRFGEPATDAAGRAKQARFLTGRGFPSDVVWRVVKGVPGSDRSDGD